MSAVLDSGNQQKSEIEIWLMACTYTVLLAENVERRLIKLDVANLFTRIQIDRVDVNIWNDWDTEKS
jgi:hypothetical protein